MQGEGYIETKNAAEKNDGCRQKKNAADIRLMTDEIVCRKMKMLSIKTEGCQGEGCRQMKNNAADRT